MRIEVQTLPQIDMDIQARIAPDVCNPPTFVTEQSRFKEGVGVGAILGVVLALIL